MKNSKKLVGVLVLLVVALLAAPQVAKSRDARVTDQAEQARFDRVLRDQDAQDAARHPLLQTDYGRFALKATREHCRTWHVDPRTLPESSPIEVAIKRALVAERL